MTVVSAISEGATGLAPALDAEDPTPLYHQIAQAIRWRIGTGDLGPGDRLPPLRQAAEEWGVNLHTVRQAYRALVQTGLLDSRPGAGTTVSGDAGRAGSAMQSLSRASDLDRWIETILAEARRSYGLTADELSARLDERSREPAIATLVECNRHQCVDLAGQVAARLGARVDPWALETPGEPPPGVLVGTRFHAAEMRSRWPGRRGDMRFVSLRLDPGFSEALRQRIRELRARRLTLCDADTGTARQMAADVSTVIGWSRPIDVLDEPPDYVRARLDADELLLVAPRRWDSLSVEVREDPRVLEVRHVIDPDQLQTLGELL